MSPLVAKTTIEVKRERLSEFRTHTVTLDVDAEVAAGRVVLAIDQFALTANNITYAAYGDAMSYWQFFPANDGYGRIPVWGFADVLASGNDAIGVGARFLGYFPMASHLIVTLTKVSPARFTDGAAHRAPLPALYNVYERVTAEQPGGRSSEARQMLLRPLAATSFLIADFLDDNALFGATQVVISSASSKTSICLAQCLRRLTRPGLVTVGLTSATNRTFVDHVGAFDRSVTYDDIPTLDPRINTVFVDMAGNADVIRHIHMHFAGRLVYSCRVGATHWQDKAGRLDLPGAKPVFFFAPAQIEKRRQDWGPGGFELRFSAAWQDLVAGSHWLAIEHHKGAEAIAAIYQRLLAGNVAPDAGLILSLA